MELLTELFDEETTLPITNLNPKKKIPQIFSVHADDAVEQPGFRFCTYTSGGDTNRDLKPGDKMMHIIPFTLTAKGSIAKLKSVGQSPINFINAIFSTAFSTMKKYKIDACMLRILKSKTAGQSRQIQVIADRLIRSRAGGRYVLLRELWDYDKKYAYILIHRKNVSLEDIPGVPEISTELFTKVNSNVGDVYINKDTGTQVTKNEAIAATIAQENDKRSDQAVIAKVKISRRAIAQSQSVEAERFEDEKWQEYEATAAEFSKPATAPLIPEATELETFISSKASKAYAAGIVAKGLFNKMNKRGLLDDVIEEEVRERYSSELLKRIGDSKLTSVKSMQAYTSLLIENFNKYEEKFKAEQEAELLSMPEDLKQDHINTLWQKARADFIKTSLKSYAGVTASNIWTLVQSRSPKNYSAAEKRGIKEYVGSGYVDINNMLLGRYDDKSREILDRDEVETAIKNLDSAFKTGDRLPEGVTLWRAQSIRAPIYEALVKNRVFYFRNYVSTSLYPIVFGGWKGNFAIGLIDDESREEINIDKNEEGITISSDRAQSYQDDPGVVRVSVGWAIDGADKINVVFPGDLSPQSQEMEVILPRGTMLKVNKITDASYNDGISYSNHKFIQAEVMTSEEIQESVVYDGDVLLETGELVALDGSVSETESELSFASFVSSRKKEKANSSLGIIASCININDIPYKFVQG